MTASVQRLTLSEYGDAEDFQDPRGSIATAIGTQNKALKWSLGLREEPFVVSHAGGRSTFRARGIAGSVRVGATWIDVIPQFAAREPDGWVEALLTIMHRATAKRAFEIPFGAIAGRRLVDFVDHISMTFANHLNEAYNSGLIRTYHSSVDSGRAVRGRLLTTPSAIVAVLRRPGIVTFEETLLDERNDFNDLLLWAGNILLGLTRKARVRTVLRSAIMPLRNITVAPKDPPRRLAPVPRQYGEYSVPLQIAEELLRGNVSGIKAVGVEGAALLVKTSSIYERFVERSVSIAAAKLRLSSRYQASVEYGSPQGAYPPLCTRPDVLVNKANAPLLVIDAKYKIVDDVMQRSGTANDYYQVLTSMIAHKVRHGLLLFPTRSHLTDRLQSWTVLIGGERYILYSASLDIERASTKEGLAAVDNDLLEFLRIAVDMTK